MRIYFDNVDFARERAGPSCFALRLARQLSSMGHVIADAHDYDVAVAFIEATPALNLEKPYVHRLDGIWFRPDQVLAGANDGIQRTYDKAASVVWQSDFDRRMTCSWFGERTGRVIRNGIEIEPARVRSEALVDIRSRYDKVFVSSSQWHPQKRLRDNLEVFKKIRAEQHPNSCMVVMGGGAVEPLADKGIFYTGDIRHDLCAEVYAIADWMIHCAWLDHSPNVVVEAISQGCPVICASEGGTKELVQPSNGVVVDDAERYDYRAADYDDPPRVPMANIPVLPEGFRADPSTVDIAVVAKEYERALLEAVGS